MADTPDDIFARMGLDPSMLELLRQSPEDRQASMDQGKADIMAADQAQKDATAKQQAIDKAQQDALIAQAGQKHQAEMDAAKADIDAKQRQSAIDMVKRSASDDLYATGTNAVRRDYQASPYLSADEQNQLYTDESTKLAKQKADEEAAWRQHLEDVGNSGFSGKLSSGLAHLDSELHLSENAPILVAVGMAIASGGASAALSSSLLEAGIVSSAAVADAAAAAIVNSTIQMASGVPPEKALGNAALSFGLSQYVSPAIAAEVKSVVDSPAVVNLATSMGTSVARGVLTGQSADEIAKNALGAGAGSLAGSLSKDVGQRVLDNIEDPDIANIASKAAAAGTKALVLGKDVGKAALDAGATAAVDPASDYLAKLDLGSDGGLSDYVKSLKDSAGAALQPISDVATKVLQPLGQPIKDAYQATADATTKVLQPLEQPVKEAYQATADKTTEVLQPVEGAVKDAYQATADKATEVLQPLEQPIKDAYQATADKATEVLQPVEGAIKDVAQAGSDVVTKALDKLPTIDTPTITLPKTPVTQTQTSTAQTPAAQAPVATAAAPVETVRRNNRVGEIDAIDLSEAFDPLWFSRPQKSDKPTKIASGGYLDRLLEQPTSFEDLLRTLRS